MTRPRKPHARLRRLATAATLAAALAAAGARAEDTRKAPPPPIPERSREGDAARYCANVAPSIEEARIAWRMKRLDALDAEIKARIDALERAEAAARDWVAQRQAMLKSANDDVVAIYAKMQPETAANQIGAMDDSVATAILAKLKPAAASAILNEMPAERASKLAAQLAGASPTPPPAPEEKKS